MNPGSSVRQIGAKAAVFGHLLLAAFVITGIAVGAGVPASWTYIAEQAPSEGRAKHVGTAQLAWSVGPLIGFALDAALALLELGLLVPAIRPPTVAPGTSRLRVALSAAHTDEQLDRLAAALTSVFGTRGSPNA